MEFSSKVLVSKCTKVGPASTQVCLTLLYVSLEKKKKVHRSDQGAPVCDQCMLQFPVNPTKTSVQHPRKARSTQRKKFLVSTVLRTGQLRNSIFPYIRRRLRLVPSFTSWLLPSSTPENRGRDRETIFRVSNYNFPKAHCLAFLHAARDIERGGERSRVSKT